jgi:hypothetical protein
MSAPTEWDRTHYEGCYETRGHHECAIAEIDRLSVANARLAHLREENERLKTENAILRGNMGDVRAENTDMRAEIRALREENEFQGATIKALLPYQNEAVALRAELATMSHEKPRQRPLTGFTQS